jgi:hypothetical protein
MADYKPNELVPIFLANDVIFKDFYDDDWDKIAIGLGVNFKATQRLYRLLHEGGTDFNEQIMLGPKIKVHVDWEAEQVDLQVGTGEKHLSLTAFYRLLGILDSLYAPLYPLGTVVNIAKSMLPPYWQDILQSDDDQLTLIISGRKLALPEPYDGYVMDYYARPWPIGELPSAAPIALNNMMIDDVLHMGYVNELELEMQDMALRKTQLARQQVSAAFMPLDLSLGMAAEYADVLEGGE